MFLIRAILSPFMNLLHFAIVLSLGTAGVTTYMLVKDHFVQGERIKVAHEDVKVITKTQTADTKAQQLPDNKLDTTMCRNGWELECVQHLVATIQPTLSQKKMVVAKISQSIEDEEIDIAADAPAEKPVLKPLPKTAPKKAAPKKHVANNAPIKHSPPPTSEDADPLGSLIHTLVGPSDAEPTQKPRRCGSHTCSG